MRRTGAAMVRWGAHDVLDDAAAARFAGELLGELERAAEASAFRGRVVVPWHRPGQRDGDGL